MGLKEIGIRKSEFVATTQFLCIQTTVQDIRTCLSFGLYVMYHTYIDIDILDKCLKFWILTVLYASMTSLVAG